MFLIFIECFFLLLLISIMHCWLKFQDLLLLCKKTLKSSLCFYPNRAFRCNGACCFYSYLNIFYCCHFFPSLFVLCAGGFCYYFSPEEPPPRPPQPAVLIKSKSGFSQQLFTHCSCPLCSLLVPLLKGTSQSFSSFPCLSLQCPPPFFSTPLSL